MNKSPEIKALLKRLEEEQKEGDDEAYHSIFDAIIEQRLKEVDPEFAEFMDNVRKKDEMRFWYA